MVSNLSPIIEKWAELYKPISHDPKQGSKDKAFYPIRAVDAESEFVRNVNTAKSPCVCYSVLIDAQNNGKSISYAHSVYFLMKSTATSLRKTARQDDLHNTDIQLELDGYVQDFLAYLYDIKRTGKNPLTGEMYDSPTFQSLRGLILDKAQWASIPTSWNGWQIMALNFEQEMPRVLCVNQEKYKEQG